ncbi:hypothetical protein M5M_04650 [Simiduia agarivorans SA1 = DSM 21679]|uniref:Uncharacterized protein n=2 Tax=Simiduia TaxID=447467 RepID=K4KW32_SIMAS|nr:hypothetical protein M5M_04650 [Simiduia agarivorans SA1 = DSM 21679]
MMLVLATPTVMAANGLSEEEALSLAADLMLIKFENRVDQCEKMGAKNMAGLYDALRLAGARRTDVLPVKSTQMIERAKQSYRTGLAQLPVSRPEKADHVALICDRTYNQLAELDSSGLLKLAERGVAEFGLR